LFAAQVDNLTSSEPCSSTEHNTYFCYIQYVLFWLCSIHWFRYCFCERKCCMRQESLRKPWCTSVGVKPSNHQITNSCWALTNAERPSTIPLEV